MLLKAILTRSIANCNITRKNNRKFLSLHVICPPCLHQILRIVKFFHWFTAILAIGVPLSSHLKLSSAMPHPLVKNTLNFPFLLVVNENRRKFSMNSFRKSFIIVRVVGLDYRAVENLPMPLIYPSVHTNCIVLGMLIVFDNNKGFSPSSLLLPCPARLCCKLVSKNHYQPSNLHRPKMILSLGHHSHRSCPR